MNVSVFDLYKTLTKILKELRQYKTCFSLFQEF